MTVQGNNDSARNRALLVLLVTIVLALLAWVLLRRATEAGLNRLTLLDRARATCDSLIVGARNREDSTRVAMTALRDTVDPQSDKAIRTCGDLARAQ